MARRKKKRRSKTPARARKLKRKPARKPKPKVKRKPAKRKPAKRKSAKRSAAAKRSWEKRRKRDRLLQAMVDQSLQRMIERQPQQSVSPAGTGWKRVTQLNLEHMNSQETPEQRALRLRTIRELGLEFPTRDFLYDYLAWAAEEFDADISDMYAMYFGYKIGGGEK